MKLAGYIVENKGNSFQEPVYKDDKSVLHCHEIDNRYNITAFRKFDRDEKSVKKVYLSKVFKVNSKAAIVFTGLDDYVHFDTAPNAIEEVIHYLNDHSAATNFDGILDQAMLLKNRIFSDHFVVENFVVKMKPEEEQIILSFDFPSAKKDMSVLSESIENTQSLTSTNEKSTKKDDEDAIFSKAMKQLNSVDMNFELKLRLRADERRSKLKTFNYQFKLNQNASRRKKASE